MKRGVLTAQIQRCIPLFMTHPSQINFQTYFVYDRETDRLIRKRTGKPAHIYYKLKRADSRPYGVVEVKERRFAVHRVVWAVVHGVWPDGVIDHINRDTTDNRVENLRIVTSAGNAKNKTRARNNSSGHNGVDYSFGKWRVRVGPVFGGRYDTLDLAIKVRDLLYQELGYTEDHGA